MQRRRQPTGMKGGAGWTVGSLKKRKTWTRRDLLHHCSDSPGHSLHLQVCYCFRSFHAAPRGERVARKWHLAAAAAVVRVDSQGLSEPAHQEPNLLRHFVVCCLSKRGNWHVLGSRVWTDSETTVLLSPLSSPFIRRERGHNPLVPIAFGVWVRRSGLLVPAHTQSCMLALPTCWIFGPKTGKEYRDTHALVWTHRWKTLLGPGVLPLGFRKAHWDSHNRR